MVRGEEEQLLEVIRIHPQAPAKGVALPVNLAGLNDSKVRASLD